MIGQFFLAAFAAGLVAGVGGPARPAEAVTLGDKVITYCQAKLGQTVGNGECAGLAAKALAHSGAKKRGGPDSPNTGDYVWGRQVYMIEAAADGPKETGKLTDVRPGDIMQYRGVKFGEKGGFAHHTAVVAEVFADKKRLPIYQQNAGGKRFVTEGHPNLGTLAEGWIRIYRPIAVGQ
jgi:hypothetical protein